MLTHYAERRGAIKLDVHGLWSIYMSDIKSPISESSAISN
jgi:hypothetical protein